MAEQIQRADAPVELTWNLKDLFATPADFDADIKAANAETAKLADQAKSFTADAAHFYAVIRGYYEAQERLDRLGLYAELAVSQDTTDPAAAQLAATYDKTQSAFDAQLSWFEPAIVAMPASQVADFAQAEPRLKQYDHALARIRTQVGHVLTSDQESLLASFGTTFDSAEDIESTLDDADLTYGDIDYGGKTQPLTKGLRRVIQQNADAKTREQASRQFAKAYYDHRYTFAATMQAHMHTQNTLARVRHYKSARDMDLSANQIPETVYDTLLDQTHAHLDLLHRYYALRKRVLGLDTLHTWDLAIPLTGTKPPFAPTYEEAKATDLAALAPLGEDYQEHLEDEFAHRWVDVLETKGKTSGGFENVAYGVHPYILLNWTDTYDAMSTLAHESGHAMQSVYANESQPYWDHEYPIFTAEIASTTNESLLNAYMLNQTKGDHDKQVYLLTTAVEDFIGTVYRQSQFAEFEKYMYETEAAGTPLTADDLSAKYHEIEMTFYGSDVAPNPWPEAYWAYIPHFYYNYYMYQYSTSKAIATTLANRILTEGAPAVAAYKEFLRAGNSDTPVNILKRAGIDVTKPDYLEAAFATFQRQLEALEAELEK